MIKKKTKPKGYLQLLNDKCPKCSSKLAVRFRHSDNKKFIGCSNFPDCKYTKSKTEVDFAREDLGVPIEWRPNLDYKLLDIFSRCQSSKEKLFLLGAIYYLNTDNFDYSTIIYKDTKYYGLIFKMVYQYMNMGGYTPTSLAIASQVEFRDNIRTYHHDFGIFLSDKKCPTENDWWLELAVEVDFHPDHELKPGQDKYRDSVVEYKVLRLKKGNEPKNWFRSVESTINSNVEDAFENMKENK